MGYTSGCSRCRHTRVGTHTQLCGDKPRDHKHRIVTDHTDRKMSGSLMNDLGRIAHEEQFYRCVSWCKPRSLVHLGCILKPELGRYLLQEQQLNCERFDSRRQKNLFLS